MIHARIKQAHFLLTEIDLSISAVAQLAGYPDPFAFSKQFKKVVGYPPSRLKE